MENGTSLFQKPDDPLLTYLLVSVHLQVHVLYLTSMSRWEIRPQNNHWQVWKILIYIVRGFHPSQSKYWTSQCIGRFQTSWQIGLLSKERYSSKKIHTGCRTLAPVNSLLSELIKVVIHSAPRVIVTSYWLKINYSLSQCIIHNMCVFILFIIYQRKKNLIIW